MPWLRPTRHLSEYIPGAAPLTASPTGIASGEAFGTAQVNLTVFPAGLASGEAFGTTQVNLAVFPAGITSGETFGTPIISKACLENTAEGGSNGTTVSTANSGGASGDPWDSVSIAGTSTITFSNAFAHDGSLSIKFVRAGGSSSLIWDASLLDQDGAFNVRFYVYLTAIPATQTDLLRLTNAAGSGLSRIALLSTGRLRLVDTTTLVGSTTSVIPTGQWVRVEAQFDTVNNTAELKLFLTADDVTPTDDVTVTTATFLSDVAKAEFGIQGASDLDALYLDSIKVCNQGWIGGTKVNVNPTGIASAEAFGTLTITLSTSPTGIASAETFGTTQVNLTVFPAGIASAGAFGNPTVNLAVSPTGIASAETFGTAKINLTIYPSGLASQEAFGAPTVATVRTIFPTGIPSAETFGTLSLLFGPITVSPTGIASAQTFGTPVVTAPPPQDVLIDLTDQAVSPVEVSTSNAFSVYLTDAAAMPVTISTSPAFSVYLTDELLLEPELVSQGT